MIIDLFILLVCSIAIALLGLVIFVRNPARATNRRFAFLSVALISWTVFNYISDHSNSHVLLTTRFVFFGGVLTAFSLLYFIANFPSDTLYRKHVLIRANAIFTAVLLCIVFSRAFISSVVIQGSGATINTSVLYPLYLIYIAFTLLVLILVIRKQNRTAKSSLQKQQIQIISWGIILYAGLAVTSNVLLPLIIHNWSSSRFGPAFSLFFVAVIAYTIIKHKLFDIHLIVARTVAYVLTLGTIAAVFGGVVFGVLGRFLGANTLSIYQQIAFIVIAIFLAFSFQSIRHFFDKQTNRLFYQDAYDPQGLLNALNKELVATINLDKLLMTSAQVIGSTLKAEYCLFGIKGVSKASRRIIGDNNQQFDEKAITMAGELTAKTRQKVVLTDSLENSEQALRELLRNNNIAMFGRLIESAHSSREGLGYIMLGPKKSGTPYSSQDQRLIEIITDELVIAVQNALRFEEIQQFNITLQQKVDEATKQLRQTNDKLRALDETKDEFISMASHQLRTPLTSVKGYVSMVLEGDAGKISKMQKELLNQAFVSSQRMVYLIADLLNVSRLRTGKFVIENKPTQLADVIETELEQLVETAKSRHLQLIYNKPKEFPSLMLDETKIRQVIMNFVDNAIYYTPADGHITVNLADKGESIELTVNDDGLGVPKTEQHHLFTKFYRANNAKRARPDGTGLGLFMAKKVIIAQGGAVIFNSTEGKGSTFGFSFAKSKLAPLPPGFKKTETAARALEIA